MEVTAGNLKDGQMLKPMRDAIPARRTGRRRGPQHRREKLPADTTYGSRRYRHVCWERKVMQRIAR